jgi:cell division septal protein FtsQ
MKTSLAIVLALFLAACGDKPAPKAAKPPPAPPQAKLDFPQPETPKLAEAPADPNKQLAQKVKKSLEGEAKIQAAGIDVTAKDGVVTLWGTTTTVEEMHRAAQVAAQLEGVKSVDNRLKVVGGS